IERAKDIESIVMQGTKRSYYRVRFAERFDCPVTVDSVGCCLSCAFCWNSSRNTEMKPGKFYEPEEIATKAVEIATKENMWRFRVSGCETILGKASTDHFCKFMDSILAREGGKNAVFLLETNGIMLGHSKELVHKLSKYKDHLAVRVSIKGEDPQQFEKLSGAKAQNFEYQKLALDYCYELGIPSLPAIMSTFMDLAKVSNYLRIHPDDIDQEKLKFYPSTKKTLIERGCWEMRRNVKA
ncbi:MAG TPA: radical SAM protein, partial [Syntrophales bacterium]|nr:radical SAM protein [Syntrophales bacterium]